MIGSRICTSQRDGVKVVLRSVDILVYMRTVMMKNVVNIVVLLVVSTGMAFSQSDIAVVFGVVKDPTGAAIAGATVQLRNEATGVSRQLQSNENGLFYFTLLPSGSYEFTVEAAGFKQYRDSHVRIQVAQVGRV